MFFFCPLDNPRAAQPTTLERERDIAPDWQRERHGMVVDAADPASATATALAYLLACYRSGRPEYAPIVTVDVTQEVPVARLIGDAPVPSLLEAVAIRRMIADAQRASAKPIADNDAASINPEG